MQRALHFNSRHRLQSGLAGISALVFVLAGCGGDDTTATVAPPAAVAAAASDAASVAWNAASTISVAANDTIANGAASLAISTPPTHGTAVVDGTTIRYTPTAGYFGPDTLSYTLTVGTAAPSTAAVNISVAASLTLTGTVTDAALPGATVVATVGATAASSVTADATGAYSLAVTSTDPTALITLKATGAGAQSSVVLTGVVGDMAQAASAAASGVVTASALPTAKVTHFSTAVAVLTQLALGKAPTSAAEVASVRGRFSAFDVVNAASAIKLVADGGVALPTGVKDTVALVSDAATLRAFLAGQSVADATAKRAVLTDPVLAVVPKVPAAGESPQTLRLVAGIGSLKVVTAIELRSDRTATVTDVSSRTATWALAGTDLVLTYDHAESTRNEYATDDGQTVVVTTTGLVVRQLADAAAATLVTLATSALEDGTPYATPVDPGAPLTVVTAFTPFTAATDFAPGTRWGGVLAVNEDAAFAPVDVLRFVDAGTAVFERANVNVAYALTDGKLTLTLPSGDTVAYQRIFTGPRGEDRWLAEGASGGKPLYSYDLPTFKVQRDLVPFTVSSLSHDWEGYFDAGYSNDQFFVELRADGSSTTESIDESGTASTASATGTWTIDAAGQMVASRRVNASYNIRRTWQLLGTVGNRIYVIELNGAFVDGADDSGFAHRLTVYQSR